MRPGFYAFAAAAAFSGAAIYAGLVEQPARLALGARAMLKEWRQSNRRGALLLEVLAVMSAILAYAEYAANGGVRWTIGGLIIVASWPYAYFVMTRVNVSGSARCRPNRLFRRCAS